MSIPIFFKILDLAVPTLLASFISILTIHIRLKRDPLTDYVNGRPQVQSYNIQSPIDLENISGMKEIPPCYLCQFEIKIAEDGQRSIGIILNEIRLDHLRYDHRLAYYCIRNNSQMDIAVDSLTTYEGRTVPMNGYSQLYVEKDRQVALLFDLNMKPKEIRLDFGNTFLTYEVIDRPQTLKVIRRTIK